MAQALVEPTKAQKIQAARDLQHQLYREIGISAVAAALRFTREPDMPAPQRCVDSLPGVLREAGLAA